MNRSLKWILVILAALFLLPVGMCCVIALLNTYHNVQTENEGKGDIRQISINHQLVSLELVTSSADREKGLSDRAYLPLNSGMLFVFDHEDVYPFWMKDMHFPLDIVWFDRGSVVDVKMLTAPLPGQSPAIYAPTKKADRVLEVNAGQADVLGLKIGARVNDLP